MNIMLNDICSPIRIERLKSFSKPLLSSSPNIVLDIIEIVVIIAVANTVNIELIVCITFKVATPPAMALVSKYQINNGRKTRF